MFTLASQEKERVRERGSPSRDTRMSRDHEDEEDEGAYAPTTAMLTGDFLVSFFLMAASGLPIRFSTFLA